MSDLGPDARSLFRSARRDLEPSGEDRARTNRAVARRLGIAAGTLVSAATSASSSAAAGSAAGAAVSFGVVKWVGVAVVAGAVGLGGAVAYRAQAPHPTAGTRAAAAVTSSAVTAPVSVPSNMSAVPPAIEAPPVSVAATPLAAQTAASPPVARKPPSAAPTAPLAPEPEADEPRPVPSPLSREMVLVRGGSEALRAGDAARALALLDEHARQFPNGVLAEERSAERVSALCKLGRTSEARVEAARFLRATPDSPLAGSVRSSCGGTGAP